jgi:hypothetical protein
MIVIAIITVATILCTYRSRTGMYNEEGRARKRARQAAFGSLGSSACSGT